MKLVAPYTGVVVTAGTEEQAKRLMERGYQQYTPKKKTGRTKAELVEKVDEHLTNKEMEEAVAAAKKSPAKPKHRKAK